MKKERGGMNDTPSIQAKEEEDKNKKSKDE